MRSFGAIFAALTLALSASAAAIYPRDGSVTTDNVGGVLGAAATVGQVLSDVTIVSQNNNHKSRQLQDVTSEITKLPKVPRDYDDSSFPSIVIGVTHEIVEIAADLDVVVKGKVDVNAVIIILSKINLALKVAIDAIAKLDLKASTVLVLNGEVQVVAQIALFIYALIRVVVNAVVVVLDVKVLAEVTAIVKLCTAISVNVSAIITVGVALVPGLVAAVVRLIVGIQAHLGLSVFAAIVGVLHI